MKNVCGCEYEPGWICGQNVIIDTPCELIHGYVVRIKSKYKKIWKYVLDEEPSSWFYSLFNGYGANINNTAKNCFNVDISVSLSCPCISGYEWIRLNILLRLTLPPTKERLDIEFFRFKNFSVWRHSCFPESVSNFISNVLGSRHSWRPVPTGRCIHPIKRNNNLQ